VKRLVVIVLTHKPIKHSNVLQAFADRGRVCVVPGPGASGVKGKTVVTPNDEGSVLLQAKFISLEREEFLVTAQTNGIHIWNDAGTEHLSFIPAKDCTKGSYHI
jgi:hypothetical protein